MLAASDEMRHHLGVGRGLEDAAFLVELVANLRRIDEIAVVREREIALAEGEDERLRVRQRTASCRGVADVADRGAARERCEIGLG